MDRIACGALRRGLCHHRSVFSDATAANVRKTFLEYFQRDHNHLFIPSSPVQPKMDPTVSFVVSGMNQFKDVFLGNEVPAAGRVVNSQKCIRIKGKHNDLCQVGLDGTHHTFFEMLGNWSFQDYFKKEACLMSWKLLTEVYSLPPERLYVTYFKGDDALGLPPDLETKEIWREIGLPERRILPFGMADNFWEMGSVGPCGPATEIHYDHVPGRREASGLVNTGDPLVTELWNIVFIEFERRVEGDLRSLGKTFVDTGMGFERLVAILQGQTSNYETDLFRPLFDAIERVSGARGYQSTYGDDTLDRAYRMLADHSRMLTVAIGDGMTPFNHYRLRSIFRKAFAIQRDAFKTKTGLVKELSNLVAEMLSPVYPEIGRNLDRVHWVVDFEEEAFNKRGEESLKSWKALVKKVPAIASIDLDLKEEFVNGYKYLERTVLDKGGEKITGEIGFRLYDTYGMTRQVIEKLAEILGLSFSAEEFAEYSQQNSERSRTDTQNLLQQQQQQQKAESVMEIPADAEKTDDSSKYEYSVDIMTGNYDLPEVAVRVLCVLLNGKAVSRVEMDDLKGNKKLGLVFDKTPLFHKTEEFTSDKGVLVLSDSVTLRIYQAVKHQNYVIHYAVFETVPQSYEFSPGITGMVRVSGKNRRGVMRGNTASLILKSLLHTKLKVFSEKMTQVKADSVKVAVMGHPLAYLDNNTLEMENEVSEALLTGGAVERKWCSLREIQEMDNLLRRAGDTYIHAETPVACVETPWMTARFRCCGPLVKYLSEVEGFAIVNVESQSYRVRSVHCVTGPKAAEVKSNNASVAERWNQIRNFHIISGVDPEVISERVQIVQKFLKEVNRPEYVSHYIKTSIVEEASMKLSRMARETRLLSRFVRKEARKMIK